MICSANELNSLKKEMEGLINNHKEIEGKLVNSEREKEDLRTNINVLLRGKESIEKKASGLSREVDVLRGELQEAYQRLKSFGKKEVEYQEKLRTSANKVYFFKHSPSLLEDLYCL